MSSTEPCSPERLSRVSHTTGRCGGWGEGARGECWGRARQRGFSGGVAPHMVCDPRSRAHLKSSSGYRIQRVCPHIPCVPHPRPVAPLDPASGSSGATVRWVGWGRAAESAGLVLAGVARGPFGSSGPSCDPRTGVARCVCWGEGVRLRGVSGWLPQMACNPRSCAHLISLNPVPHTAGPSRICCLRVPRPAYRRSARSGQRIADRRCAAERGGKGARRVL